MYKTLTKSRNQWTIHKNVKFVIDVGCRSYTNCCNRVVTDILRFNPCIDCIYVFNFTLMIHRKSYCTSIEANIAGGPSPKTFVKFSFIEITSLKVASNDPTNNQSTHVWIIAWRWIKDNRLPLCPNHMGHTNAKPISNWHNLINFGETSTWIRCCFTFVGMGSVFVRLVNFLGERSYECVLDKLLIF